MTVDDQDLVIVATEPTSTDRYSIVQHLAGQGGFGRIDKAMDTALERPVAIKTSDPLFKDCPTEDDVERFRREAKSLAQLSHPSIPAIYDVEFTPSINEFRIIFEWVEGQTLHQHLQEVGVLSLQDARNYFTQICSALTHAHSKGLVHRDIKPSNIVLNDSMGGCYLVDFGIALSLEDITRITKGTALGSLGYMSPEQERGDAITSASDVFSLAVVLYESLAGTRPTVGSYKSLTLHNESYPPGLDELIKQSLQQDHRLRPQTAHEFIGMFNSALRPHASFATTLKDGSLYEIQLALSEMSPEEFSALPAGQRVLVMMRLTDLATVDEDRLRSAVASLLLTLVGLAQSEKGYPTVIKFAFQYGYKKRYGEKWVGNVPVRDAIRAMANKCGAQAHALIWQECSSLATIADLPAGQGWYVHDLRLLLQNLLINPVCSDENAEAIGDALRELNAATH